MSSLRGVLGGSKTVVQRSSRNRRAADQSRSACIVHGSFERLLVECQPALCVTIPAGTIVFCWPGNNVRTIDLFCGAGGFSLGAHHAGMTVEAAFDLDPILTSSYKTNFPSTEIRLADIATMSGSDVRDKVEGKVDGVFGGPPCQAFSSIGRRDSNDPRRLLLGHFFRLVAELEPAFFVMENVLGLAQNHSRAVLDAAIEFVVPRYTVLPPAQLDAADFGAATTRKRIFVIGYDRARCDPVQMSDIEKLSLAPTTVSDAITDLEGATREHSSAEQLDTWRLAPSESLSAYAKSLRSPDSIITGHTVPVHGKAVVERFRGIPPGGIDAVGRHPRLEWLGQCPTLRAGTGPDKGSYQSVRPIHPDHPRLITVREAARLQGFPDRHIFHRAVWHSFRMIGNSVSPFIAKAILRAIASRCSHSESEAEVSG